MSRYVSSASFGTSRGTVISNSAGILNLLSPIYLRFAHPIRYGSRTLCLSVMGGMYGQNIRICGHPGSVA
ncbi:hypothetical protein ASZ90_009781 [hydrocarbon metagenome]|uniref:Uncharacterized protein n=1 Tax=hydrocarbon metagenome TaxID=938273 RepID=A0A0W8FHV6_9ZZZZ